LDKKYADPISWSLIWLNPINGAPRVVEGKHSYMCTNLPIRGAARNRTEIRTRCGFVV
jgi:hypothetical protein